MPILFIYFILHSVAMVLLMSQPLAANWTYIMPLVIQELPFWLQCPPPEWSHVFSRTLAAGMTWGNPLWALLHVGHTRQAPPRGTCSRQCEARRGRLTLLTTSAKTNKTLEYSGVLQSLKVLKVRSHHQTTSEFYSFSRVLFFL